MAWSTLACAAGLLGLYATVQHWSRALNALLLGPNPPLLSACWLLLAASVASAVAVFRRGAPTLPGKLVLAGTVGCAAALAGHRAVVGQDGRDLVSEDMVDVLYTVVLGCCLWATWVLLRSVVLPPPVVPVVPAVVAAAPPVAAAGAAPAVAPAPSAPILHSAPDLRQRQAGAAAAAATGSGSGGVTSYGDHNNNIVGHTVTLELGGRPLFERYTH